MAVLKILSGGAMRPLLTEAMPLFEQASGNKAEVRFALTSALAKEIEAGAAFDLALLPRPELDELVRAGKITADSVADIARSAVGLCVRAGAPKPGIGTVAAFKAALLAARTVGYSDGPSGAYVASLFERLGIAAGMKPKVRLTSRPVAEIVAAGEAEIGLQQIVAILPVKGAELVGPLPGELQNVIVYAMGTSSEARHGDAARALTAFLGSSDAIRVMRVKGLEPG